MILVYPTILVILLEVEKLKSRVLINSSPTYDLTWLVKSPNKFS